jgi:hypothetical protein
MSAPAGRPVVDPAISGHAAHTGVDPACLTVLSERLRESPGVVAIEADFHDHKLTVRYRPSQLEPDRLNALADEVAALFAERVTLCQRREVEGACSECDLLVGRAAQLSEFAVTADPERVGLSRRSVPPDTADLVRPLAGPKPWGNDAVARGAGASRPRPREWRC